MSYTPPAGDAAHFSWVGAFAYTPPAGGAAHFTWVPDSTGAGVLAFNGTAWVTATVKRWDGVTWAVATVKRWDGTTWQ